MIPSNGKIRLSGSRKYLFRGIRQSIILRVTCKPFKLLEQSRLSVFSETFLIVRILLIMSLKHLNESKNKITYKFPTRFVFRSHFHRESARSFFLYGVPSLHWLNRPGDWAQRHTKSPKPHGTRNLPAKTIGDHKNRLSFKTLWKVQIEKIPRSGTTRIRLRSIQKSKKNNSGRFLPEAPLPKDTA